MLFRSDKVKRSEHGVIVDPIFLSPQNLLSDATELMEKYKISGVPITEHGKLVGIITNRDMRFETDLSRQIGECMTSEGLVTAPEGTSLEMAKSILSKKNIKTGWAGKPQCLKDERKMCAYDISLSSSIYSI